MRSATRWHRRRDPLPPRQSLSHHRSICPRGRSVQGPWVLIWHRNAIALSRPPSALESTRRPTHTFARAAPAAGAAAICALPDAASAGSSQAAPSKAERLRLFHARRGRPFLSSKAPQKRFPRPTHAQIRLLSRGEGDPAGRHEPISMRVFLASPASGVAEQITQAKRTHGFESSKKTPKTHG